MTTEEKATLLLFVVVAAFVYATSPTTHTVQGKGKKRKRKTVSGLWPSDPKAMADDAPASAAEGDDAMFPPAGFDYPTEPFDYGERYGYGGREESHTTVGADRSQVFGPYTDATTQSFLSRVRSYGMTVSGSNPWHIDANQHGITLDATQDGAGNVTVAVATKNIYVSNAKIWDKLAPLMPKADR